MIEIATWEHTSAGPILFVCGVMTRDWFGVIHDAECAALCDEINAAASQSNPEGQAKWKPFGRSSCQGRYAMSNCPLGRR